MSSTHFVNSQGRLLTHRPTRDLAIRVAVTLSRQALTQVFLITDDQDHLIARIVGGNITYPKAAKKHE